MFCHRRHAILTMLMFGLVASIAMGQGSDLSRLLAPCISEQTLAIVQIDVGRIDVDAVLDWLVKTAPAAMDADEVEAVTQRWRPVWREGIGFVKTAGGERLFVVWGVGDRLLAVPITNRVNKEAMESCLTGMREDLFGGQATVARKGGLLIAGPRWMAEQWQSRAPLVRPEVARATAKARGAVIGVFVIPSMDSRRVLDAMLPTVLGQGMEAKGHPITEGLQWATISLDLPPSPSLSLTVGSTDAASASALREFVAASLSLVGRIAALKQACPNLEEALTTLTPEVKGRGLRLDISKRQCERLGTDLVTPGLFELRASILRQLCGTVLSGMTKGMLIYANDHADKWPPSLETLVDTVEYPRSDLICPAMRHRPQYESYVYRGVDTGGVWVEPMIIVVHDRAGNHKGGRHVMFADSHVEWVTEERFAELVARDNELRRGRGFPEKAVQ